MGKTAKYREKNCKYEQCNKIHRNQGVYCSNSCRNRDRVGKYSDETLKKMSESIRKVRLENPNENIMYALTNNMKRQRNPNHMPEDDLLIGEISDSDGVYGVVEGGDVWSPC